MSVGSNSSKQNSSNSSYSSPISVEDLNKYWYNLDALTGGHYTGSSNASGAGSGYGSSATSGAGGFWDNIIGPDRTDKDPVSYGTGSDASGDQGEYVAGRLANWANYGTAPVEYQGLTADDLAAVGGAGKTRMLTARQAYGDRGSEIAADPSMTLAQRQYQGGLNTRELWNTEDAVAAEVEAALTDLMSQESGRKYAADIRNSDLTKSDLETLSAIYASLLGQTTISSGSGSGGSSGFNFGLW